MDNPAVPIPLISPQPAVQPEVSSPVESQGRHWLLWLFGGIALLALGIVVGVFGAKFLNQSQSQSPLTSIPSPTLSPIPSPDLYREPAGSAATANWKTYFDPNGLYVFRYPANYSLGHYGSDNSPLLLNNRIDWGVTQHPAGGCMGDCPIVTNTQKVTIGGYSAILYEGWVGSIGGETPQSYIKYEIKQPSTDNYFVMTLWELDRTSEAQKNYSQERKIDVISEDDKKIFDQILSTFQFLK